MKPSNESEIHYLSHASRRDWLRVPAGFHVTALDTNEQSKQGRVETISG
jgi:hypothetical protein